MRINLKCPFEEKDEAKRLGARWDPAQKTWFIVDIEDLTPFMRWIGAGKTAKPQVRGNHQPKTTGKNANLTHCGCNVLPWDNCEHTIHPQ